MLYSQILVSGILIICGFLVKKYPNLIAGYNTMSKSDKKKVDIDKLSSFLKLVLISLGVFCLFSYFILIFLDVDDNTILAINSSTIVIVVIIASIISNSFKL